MQEYIKSIPYVIIKLTAEQERGFALTQITVNAGPFSVLFFTYHLCGSRRQISCPLRPCGCGRGSARITEAEPVSQGRNPVSQGPRPV